METAQKQFDHDMREKFCWTCRHYGFIRRDKWAVPGWRWTACKLKRFFFPDGEEKPGMRPGCEEWA